MEKSAWKLHVGAEVLGSATRFRVWAPKARQISVLLESGSHSDSVALTPEDDSYFCATVDGIGAGDRYLFLPEGGPARPDPASRFQPDGVHAASGIVDPNAFNWEDGHWKGIPLEDYIIYELHVGTFTREGTFDAVIPVLDYIRYLGATAVEIMPISQFPGRRNWGYDGVHPFAPQNSYGGPDGLKRLVNECHRRGLAVILDVVYNHFGPEGNYLSAFGWYFTDRYKTPWGDAINVDGPYSDQVREYFIANALYWINEYHFDSLRLDAVDRIFDFSAYPFLEELADAVHRNRENIGRQVFLFAESDLNDPRLINPPEKGGFGIDAQWNDGFHHAIHALLTGESSGYYQDYGRFEDLVKAIRESYVYTGEYSRYRQRRHGRPVRDRAPAQFVVFSQNHDQVGNRMRGERLSALVPLARLKLTAALVLLSPYIPLLFMGEEYGEKAPFQYFVDYADPDLIEAVRKGRYEEFAAFAWEGETEDPQGEKVFLEAKIDVGRSEQAEHRPLFGFYRRLLALRKSEPALMNLSRASMQVTGYDEVKAITVTRTCGDETVLVVFGVAADRSTLAFSAPDGTWDKILDASDPQWGGADEPAPAVLTVAAGRGNVGINPFCVLAYKRR